MSGFLDGYTDALQLRADSSVEHNHTGKDVVHISLSTVERKQCVEQKLGVCQTAVCHSANGTSTQFQQYMTKSNVKPVTAKKGRSASMKQLWMHTWSEAVLRKQMTRRKYSLLRCSCSSKRCVRSQSKDGSQSLSQSFRLASKAVLSLHDQTWSGTQGINAQYCCPCSACNLGRVTYNQGHA